jgi:hypothetical protein
VEKVPLLVEHLDQMLVVLAVLAKMQTLEDLEGMVG